MLAFEKLAILRKSSDFSSSFNLADVKNFFQTLALKYFYNFSPFKIFSTIFVRDNLSERLSFSNKFIVVSQPDKVEMSNKWDYLSKIYDILSDFIKFTKINTAIIQQVFKIENR